VAKALGQTPGRILEIAEAAEQDAIKKGINLEPLGTSTKVFTAASLTSLIPVFGNVLGGLIGGVIASYVKEKKEEK